MQDQKRELDIKAGYACNNNCVFCLNRRKKEYRKFPLDVLAGQIEKSARNGCKKLIISGGEPLISPDFFTLLTLARDAGISVIEIQTNARMLCYEEVVRRILRIQPVQYAFFVSLHFPDAALHNKYSRAEGFDQVIAGIRNVVRFHAMVKINTVVMKQNVDLLGKVTSLISSLGVIRQQFRMIDGASLRDNFYEFVPEMSGVCAKIRKVIRENAGKVEITVHEIPLCILGRDMEKYISAPVNPYRENLVRGNRIFMSPEIMEEQFVFPPCCARCFYRPACKGVRKDYGEIYGFEEITPFANEKNN